MMNLAHQTRIAVHIVVDDDTGSVANLVVALTLLVTMLFKVGQVITDVAWAISEVIEEMTCVNKVLVILVRAWLYGLGVPL